jgi:quercetin dioxygenase-like cupin family protein
MTKVEGFHRFLRPRRRRSVELAYPLVGYADQKENRVFMLKLRRTVAFGAIVCGLLGLAAIALATPPSGQQVSPAVVGTLRETQRINADKIKFRTQAPVEISTFIITLAPGGLTGWHTHPGVLLATVQSGAVVRQIGCESRTYSTGEAFIEHGDQPTGQVQNASILEPAAFSVTHIAPPGAPRRQDSEPPSC